MWLMACCFALWHRLKERQLRTVGCVCRLLMSRMKPRNVFDVGQGEGHDNDAGNYHENEPFNLNINQNPNDVDNDIVESACNDVSATEVQFEKIRRMYDILLMLLIPDFMIILFMCLYMYMLLNIFVYINTSINLSVDCMYSLFYSLDTFFKYFVSRNGLEETTQPAQPPLPLDDYKT